MLFVWCDPLTHARLHWPVPVNNFDIVGAILRGAGFRWVFVVRLPAAAMYYLAWGIECIHRLVGGWYNFNPFLTRAEVNKVGSLRIFPSLCCA